MNRKRLYLPLTENTEPLGFYQNAISLSAIPAGSVRDILKATHSMSLTGITRAIKMASGVGGVRLKAQDARKTTRNQ